MQNELTDEDYRYMVQILNKEKEFFHHVLHLVKTSNESSFCFLSGGAGVGKSLVTNALYQAALKYYNVYMAGVDFHEIKVLILTPTDDAAFNIKGNTIHTALQIAAFYSLKTQNS